MCARFTAFSIGCGSWNRARSAFSQAGAFRCASSTGADRNSTMCATRGAPRTQQHEGSMKRLATILGIAAMSLWGAAAFAAQPIVFVHGYSGSSSNFNTMMSRFAATGQPTNMMYGFDYASLVNSNETSASQLRSFVNTVRSRHGNAQVTIIAHSNGGLVARWYRVMLGGSSANNRFISLGSPHSGTTWAYACFSPACFDMRPLSLMITTLAGRGCDRSLWSATDGIIIPASSARCGTSIQTVSVDHLSLLTNSSVFNQVRALTPQ
nr:esterase LC-Est3 [uncultured bacterium]